MKTNMTIKTSNRLLGQSANEIRPRLFILREQWLNDFFTGTPAALALLDAGLRFMRINDTAANFSSTPVSNYVGKTIREVFPKLAPVIEPLLQKVLTTGEAMWDLELSIEIPKQPGVLQHWKGAFFPVAETRGRADAVGSILVVITERKQTGDELRRKTSFLEALGDCIPIGILVMDSQGKKILQNQLVNELWQIPPDVDESTECVELAKSAATQAKNPDEFTKKVNYFNNHPDDVIRDEIELVDGTTLDIYLSPVQDKAGKHYGRIWTFRDVTEHRRLEAHLRQAQKMEAIGQLAGGVAHDFNNILATVQMNADLLQIDDHITSNQMEIAKEISAAAQRAAALTRQLLLFSRKQTMELSDLDLNQSIGEMTKMLQRSLGEAVQLQFNFAKQPLFLHADAGMLDQVLLNLAVNARDAMPDGGLLAIETSAVEFDEAAAGQNPPARPGSFVCLCVSDTGCGIPPEVLSRIFEPFFTTKEVGKGTGLGLATVFGIVQQHQGWINVYSEVGHGTTFRIYLPRLTQPSRSESIFPFQASVQSGNETILLVEDESALRATTRIVLSRLGYPGGLQKEH
jgi:signal transduction histidine kinase